MAARHETVEDRIKNPNLNNLGSVGIALVAAAKAKEAK